MGVILNEDNNNQIDLQERIKNDNKTYFMLQQLFKNKNMSKKLKLRLKNTTDRQTDRQAGRRVAGAAETGTLTERDRKQLNIFEGKVYRGILGPVYDNKNENWRMLNNKEIFASVKKPTIIETVRLNSLCWFGHVLRIEGNRIPRRYYI